MQEFKVPLYILNIQGADVVLEVEWLRTLGSIISDFAVPRMTFMIEGKPFTLQGDTPQLPSPTTAPPITSADAFGLSS